MIAVTAVVLFTKHGGLWFAIGNRIICTAWAYSAVRKRRESASPRSDPASLLDAAARLEDVDRVKAIAAYEDIVRLFPGTPASREAARNIHTLTQQK
jgi:hypothetical protein